MIPDYKLFHGAVLSELIDVSPGDLSIGELREEGRLASYVVNKSVGLHIKHSAARLSPWQFSVSLSNLRDFHDLRRMMYQVYLVLVCGTDGFVTLSLEELVDLLEGASGDQGWLRVERRRGKWYTVCGNGGCLPYKKSQGVSEIVKNFAF